MFSESFRGGSYEALVERQGGSGYAGVCRDTIYTACERGELRHARVSGRRDRLRPEWIDAWLERHAPDVQGGRTGGRHEGRVDDEAHLPVLLTVDEAADLLRTTRRAIYAMIERRQLPGVIRVRRRVLLRADDLLDWLNQKRAPSPEE